MIFSISKSAFENVMRESFMQLPKRWNGSDFYRTIDDLFNKYKENINTISSKKEMSIINRVCINLLQSIDHYFKGDPEQAYRTFNKIMKKLMENPIKIYKKSGWVEPFFQGDDPLKLFRIRNVQNDIIYKRTDIFHTPYNLRSKVSSCRYSIAGYPSLYLGTSLALCMEESKITSLKELRIAARFELVRNQTENGNSNIKVIELAVKPQDFCENQQEYSIGKNRSHARRFNELHLSDPVVRRNYLLWYPLIAACSFIRVNKGDPFAAEYIIPQLLMQWMRKQYTENELYGIRYFSCASVKASDMGFNYVFPVSGENYHHNPNFCSVLAKSFRLTKPRFTHEYDTIAACEDALGLDLNLHVI